MTTKYNVSKGTKLLTYDFVLATHQETNKLGEKKSEEAVEKLGRYVKVVQELPVKVEDN